MARSLVMIGDGRGDVHIAATPDAAGLLGRLQRRYPRDLSILHEEADAGCLAAKVHERLATHRLRGEWFALAADGVGRVRQIIADVDDRHHNHDGPPSNSHYSNGCRHPACSDARSAYSRDYNRRQRVQVTAQPEQDAVAEPERVIEAGLASQPEPDNPGPGDEAMALAYFTKFARPEDGHIHRAMDNLGLMATATRMPEDRCQAAAVALLKAGQLRQDGDDLYLVAR